MSDRPLSSAWRVYGMFINGLRVRGRTHPRPDTPDRREQASPECYWQSRRRTQITPDGTEHDARHAADRRPFARSAYDGQRDGRPRVARDGDLSRGLLGDREERAPGWRVGFGGHDRAARVAALTNWLIDR